MTEVGAHSCRFEFINERLLTANPRPETDWPLTTRICRSRAPTASSVDGLKVHQIAPARRRIIAATEGSFLWC